jgi:S-adenosylmethionine hydrolase
MTRPIFFLTDFGLADTYVGIVKAVILGIAPDARIVDLNHDIPAQDVRAGAFALLTAAPYLPPDAVVLAVVDPGVGTARRPIAVQAEGRTFVAPDNGLVSWAIGRSPTPQRSILLAPCAGEGEPAPDGEPVTVVLDRPELWLPTVSSTFHGRDLFGPVAAHLALGVPIAEVGSPGGAIQAIPFPTPRRGQDVAGRTVTVRGEVVHVDRYGNLITSLGADDLAPDQVVSIAGRTVERLAPHFQGGEGSVVALLGSAGLLEIAVPNGSAASVLGVGVGEAVTLTRRR